MESSKRGDVQGLNNYPLDDEISLFELWDSVYSQRWLVVAVAFIPVAFAMLYLVFGPKTYEVSAIVLPPDQSEIKELSAPSVEGATREAIFSDFLENLISPDLHIEIAKEPAFRANFYKDDEVSDGEVLESINEQLIVRLPEKNKTELLISELAKTEFGFQDKEPGLTYRFMSETIAKAESVTIDMVRNDILSEIDRKVDNKQRIFELKDQAVTLEVQSEIEELLEKDREKSAQILDKVKSLNKKAEEDRLNRIVRLEESLTVAKKLGIKTPVNPIEYQRSSGATEAKIDIASRDPIGFWLGSKILSAEIETLKKRKDDSPFIAELTELTKELDMLKTNERVEMLQSRESNIPFSKELRDLKNEIVTLKASRDKIAQADFSVFKYMQRPIEPTRPVKPKKLIVLGLSLVFGVMMGLMVGLLRAAVLKRRGEVGN